MKINLTTTPKEVDVCDFLRINPGAKAVVETIFERYVANIDWYRTLDRNVVKSANSIQEYALSLVQAAYSVQYTDTVENREELHNAAIDMAAYAMLFYENIGNLKAGE